MLKGVEDAPSGDKKGLKGNGEELKGNVGIIVLLYQYVHVKVDIFLYNRCIVTFACYKKWMDCINIVLN